MDSKVSRSMHLLTYCITSSACKFYPHIWCSKYLLFVLLDLRCVMSTVCKDAYEHTRRMTLCAYSMMHSFGVLLMVQLLLLVCLYCSWIG